ncbi:hypothetical protein O6H91_05G104900 [Diphasiastrum complanatum]|nr:hypothetical protein O6H91_05G104900 [Diphasiastrum complanatum]KAJ7556934.1 hypothetical protein O6H91_05G104900 [Diphasiastrum complanatum]KAJ7556936.1 hypothetical protein O6H91_05G104900 [Diphasiastrum complanatum]
MGSRMKEDEKCEKIIRGLSKREENRKCINCGALGPQYVCTNFSIFVCTNCSGLHREFTHRVKSISMAKFTAGEVAALQAGGNQRGRESFLKTWDPQRHPLPDSSSPDKLRDFIKAVYVDRRYAEDMPPQRGKQAQPPKELHTSSFGSTHNGGPTAGSDLTLKQANFGSLIDFGADSDIPAAAVQPDPFGITSLQPPAQPAAAVQSDSFGITSLQPPVQPAAAVQSDPFVSLLQPPAQPSSAGWASFDMNSSSEPKAEAVPGMGTPVGFADPFRTIRSGVQGLATVATPAIDSWPSSLQQWGSVHPAMVTHPSDQSLQVPGQIDIQLAQKGPAHAAIPFPAQNQEIQRPPVPNNGRSAISEDLFTPFAQTSFARSGMHLGQQFPMGGSNFMPFGSALPGGYSQGSFQGYGQHPKSKNPFDLPEETTPPTGAFSNMATLQAALSTVPSEPFPDSGIRSANPLWSQTAGVNQPPSFFPSPGGGGFFNQQPSTFMPPVLQQYSFTSAPRPDQSAGYQHGAQIFVPASGFSVPQSSTHPIGGNPFG